jgi:hypothetical protein
MKDITDTKTLELFQVTAKKRGRPKSAVRAKTAVERMRDARSRRAKKRIDILTNVTNLEIFSTADLVTALYDNFRADPDGLNFSNRLIVSELILRFPASKD